MHSVKRYVVLAIIVLAIVGLSFELVSNPIGLLKSLLVVVGIVTVFYFIFRFIMERRTFRPSSHPYRPPTRAQLLKAKRTSKANRKPAMKYRKGQPHLTVIEGKKNKKKSRALF